MRKIRLIIGREIKSKLTNKTFIIMTILAPLLITGFLAFMIKMTQSEKTEQNVLVIDDSKLFGDKLVGNDYISLSFSNDNLEKAVSEFSGKGFSCVLWISPTIIEGGAGATKLFYKKSPGFAFQTYIKDQMERIVYENKLKANNIDPTIISNSKQSIKIILEKVNDKGNTEEQASFGLFGFLTGALMFMFILMYGMMVFRSVMEEKTNRIVEVIVSSVKPFELMLGKIIGVAILGIIQFIIMGIITFALTTVLSTIFLKDVSSQLKIFESQQELVKKGGTNVNFSQLEKFDDKLEVFDLLKKIQKINFMEVFICFVLYFIGGYLFYSSIMAAIGSAVDSEADSQQFITPVMIPLMVGYFIATKTIMDPDSSTVFWGSIIPFTSPIVMMSRITNGVPLWELVLSLSILFVSFVFTTWLAGKIYRTGILMYGKKTSWREIGKWLFYK
ncbi:MAG: ABC transporter permease [Bacteroidota bacterium]|nr:ABC transporter permease [Bacteroidota bacterium]MDP3145927.1 ABC transporter permease [Bacteroidota bacterium]